MFFLPIGDEPNLRGTPVVTYVLIGLNVAVFVLVSLPLMFQGVDPADPATREYLRLLSESTGFSARDLAASISAYDVFLFKYGFKPAAPSLVDLFSSMFLHAGWLHLGGNVLFLWIFGDNVELHIGRVRYIFIYLLTGIAAVALFSIFRLESLAPMVGASGAISGVLGCYFLWFPRNYVRVLFVIIFFVQMMRLPARWVLGFYLVALNLLPFLFGSESGVAYGAHIGGFVGGLGCAALLSRWQDRGRLRDSVTKLGANGADTEGAATQQLSRALARGRGEVALRIYAAMSGRERTALPDGEVLALSDWLVEREELAAALAVLQRFIATHPNSAALPRFHLRAAAVHLREMRLPAAYQNFLAVLDLTSDEREAEAARAGLTEVEKRQAEARRFSRFH